MSSKSMHFGRPQARPSLNFAPWSTRIRVILVTLLLLGVAYIVWQILHVEPPIPIPDTPVPIPAP